MNSILDCTTTCFLLVWQKSSQLVSGSVFNWWCTQVPLAHSLTLYYVQDGLKDFCKHYKFRSSQAIFGIYNTKVMSDNLATLGYSLWSEERPPDFAKYRQILKSCDQLVSNIINPYMEKETCLSISVQGKSMLPLLERQAGLSMRISSEAFIILLFHVTVSPIWNWENGQTAEREKQSLELWGNIMRAHLRGVCWGQASGGEGWQSDSSAETWRPLSAPTHCNLHSPLMIFHSYDNGTGVSDWLDFSPSKLG